MKNYNYFAVSQSINSSQNNQIETVDNPLDYITVENFKKLLEPGNISPATALFTTIISVFLSALVTIIYSEKFTVKRQRILNTFEMSKEWESEPLIQYRSELYTQLVLSPQYTVDGKPIFLRDLYEANSNSEVVWQTMRVISFFDRLSYFVEKDQRVIDKNLARKIFSRDYTYWEIDYLSIQREYVRKSKDREWGETFKYHRWLFDKGVARKLRRRKVGN